MADKKQQEVRQKRREDALRANLLRRKQQARERQKPVDEGK